MLPSENGMKIKFLTLLSEQPHTKSRKNIYVIIFKIPIMVICYCNTDTIYNFLMHCSREV